MNKEKLNHYLVQLKEFETREGTKEFYSLKIGLVIKILEAILEEPNPH